jgi:hypothetical protein
VVRARTDIFEAGILNTLYTIAPAHRQDVKGALDDLLFRDVQGARYHPLRDAAQCLYSGRVVLGLDVNT